MLENYPRSPVQTLKMQMISSLLLGKDKHVKRVHKDPKTKGPFELGPGPDTEYQINRTASAIDIIQLSTLTEEYPRFFPVLKLC